MTGSTIEIEREAGHWTDRGRAYKVLVDGSEAGEVRQGESKSFAVEPGSHEVQMKIDWCRSRPENVEVGAGEPARLMCRPAANPWTVLWYVTVGRLRYIELDVTPASADPPTPS